MTQEIKLKSGITINCDAIDVDYENGSLRLYCEISKNAKKTYYDFINSEKNVHNDEFTFLFNNLKYEAKLKTLLGVEVSNHSAYHVISMMVETKISDAKKYHNILFYIPSTSDRRLQYEQNEMLINGRKWHFKPAILQSEKILPWDMVKEGGGWSHIGYFLEVDLSDAHSDDEPVVDVNHICNLLSFACGKRFDWSSSFARCDGKLIYIASNGKFKGEREKRVIPIIRSGNDNRYWSYDPINFVRQAADSYFSDPEWWRITIEWFINMRSYNIIEISKLIEGMLLDRLKRKFLLACIGESVMSPPINADDNFEKIIRRKQLVIAQGKTTDEQDLSKLLRGWKDGYVDATGKHQNGYEYVNSIKLLVEYAGGSLDNAECASIKYRHRLAHNGDIELFPISDLEMRYMEVVQYDTSVSLIVYSLLLAAFGYSGYFNTTFGIGCVSKTLPAYNRVSFPFVRSIAQNIVSIQKGAR